MLVPFLLQFQLRSGLGMAGAPGKELIQSLWAPLKNGWILAEARPGRSGWTEMVWDKEKTLSSPKSTEANSYLSAKVSEPEVCCRDRGESQTSWGTSS